MAGSKLGYTTSTPPRFQRKLFLPVSFVRGRNEGILALAIGVEGESTAHPCEAMIANQVGIQTKGRPADNWLASVVSWTWKIKLATQMETELLGRLRELAEAEAMLGV